MDWEIQRMALRADVERLGYLDMAIVSPRWDCTVCIERRNS